MNNCGAGAIKLITDTQMYVLWKTSKAFHQHICALQIRKYERLL